MTHPNLETIQAFLIIGNVLSYNMNPGVSYILLGMTERMAFTLGLQADSQRFSGSEQYLRRRVWWALAWQDSHFSMSYDRPSASAVCGAGIPYRKNSTPGHRSYAESMFRIIQLTQEIIRGRIFNPRSTMTWGMIQSYTDEVARIVADGCLHLRDRSYCTSKTQHLERLALKLHSSYITSELCRPALKEPAPVSTPSSNPTRATSAPLSDQFCDRTKSPLDSISANSDHSPTQLRSQCVANLERTIAAYLELHRISYHAARSWIGIQRAISAAFLLGVLAESRQDLYIHSLLRDLEQVISERTRIDTSFFEPTDFQSPVVGNMIPPNPARGEINSNGHELKRGNVLNGLSGTGLPAPAATSESPHWARSMAQSLKALSKMNAALASPRISGLNSLPGNNSVTSVNGLMTAAANFQPLPAFRPGQTSPSNAALVMPATPERTGSGEWNRGNLGERVAEFVQPALWG